METQGQAVHHQRPSRLSALCQNVHFLSAAKDLPPYLYSPGMHLACRTRPLQEVGGKAAEATAQLQQTSKEEDRETHHRLHFLRCASLLLLLLDSPVKRNDCRLCPAAGWGAAAAALGGDSGTQQPLAPLASAKAC